MNPEQRLAILNDLFIADHDFFHHSVILALNFIHQLHGLNNAQNLSFFHGVTNFYEALLPPGEEEL